MNSINRPPRGNRRIPYSPPRRPAPRTARATYSPKQPTRYPVLPGYTARKPDMNYRLLPVALIFVPNCVCALVLSPFYDGGQLFAQGVDILNRLLGIAGINLYQVLPGSLTFILSALRNLPSVMSAFLTTFSATVLCCVVPVGAAWLILGLVHHARDAR